MKQPYFYLFVFLLLTAVTAGHARQQQQKYYRVDQVKTVTGEVQEIKSEPCFNDKIFMVIYLREKKTGRTYRVEVSPQWYYHLELMVGSLVEVTGSFSENKGGYHLMVRTVTYRGEHFHFRDKNGFPLWRGKGKGARGMHRGKMRRRGGKR